MSERQQPAELATVPTIRLDHLTEAQKRACILTDNRLAELAGWHREILAVELQHHMTLDLDFARARVWLAHEARAVLLD